jgi:hypothetical protein
MARSNSSTQRPNTFAQNTFRHPTIPLQSYGGPYICGQVVRSLLGECIGDLSLVEHFVDKHFVDGTHTLEKQKIVLGR